MRLQTIAAFAAGAVALFALSMTASAAPIYCAPGVDDRNFMGIDDSQVTACLASGVGNIGQAARNDDFLSTPAGSGWFNVSDDFNLRFTQVSNSGSWSFDASAWSQYADLAIGFKFGTGNNPDEWFVYSLVDLVSSGDWTFFNNFDRGGGLSHLELYARGERNSVPEPGTLGLLGLGLASMAAGMRRRRRNA